MCTNVPTAIVYGGVLSDDSDITRELKSDTTEVWTGWYPELHFVTDVVTVRSLERRPFIKRS